jgi:hypothetical protein
MQEGLDEEIIETNTGNSGAIVMRIWFELPLFPGSQGKLDTRWQETRSPSEGIYEYCGLFVPTIIPLTIH